MQALGIDIGGTSVKVCVRTPGDTTYRSSPRYRRPSRGELVHTIRELLGADTTRSVPVGLCLPGQFESDGATIRLAANIPALNGVRVPDLVADVLESEPASLNIVTDALAAARGSWSREPTAGRLLTLAMGTGVGAAVLDDGSPVTLDGRTSGHVGQIDVSLSDDAPLGPDGGRGSLEAYVGLPALRARFPEASTDQIPGIISSLPDDDDLFRALARAVRVCHAIYTPDHIRLLGGLGVALRPRLGTIRVHVDRALTGVAHTDWSFSAADDPYLAALGVAELAAESAGQTNGGSPPRGPST